MATELTKRFGARLRHLREAPGMSQELLAQNAGLHRTHVSLIERAQRVVRLETVEKLATALGVSPWELFTGLTASTDSDGANPDLTLVRNLFPAIQQYQAIATRHGIDDIFQDNGGKLLQVLLILGLSKLPGREGNDAIDAEGLEYELKSVNSRLTSSFSTHHHLNPDILRKYRNVHAWYFAVYEHIDLMKIYRLTPSQLEPFFQKWEEKWQQTRRDINNPKIALSYILQHGELVYDATH